MASIAEWIQRIKTAIYGEEVRGAIWQSLQAMNDELTSADLTQIPVNKADIANLRTDMTAVQGSVTSLQGEVEDIRVGADGTQYETAGKAVRTQITVLKEDLKTPMLNVANINRDDGRKTLLNFTVDPTSSTPQAYSALVSVNKNYCIYNSTPKINGNWVHFIVYEYDYLGNQIGDSKVIWGLLRYISTTENVAWIRVYVTIGNNVEITPAISETLSESITITVSPLVENDVDNIIAKDNFVYGQNTQNFIYPHTSAQRFIGTIFHPTEGVDIVANMLNTLYEFYLAYYDDNFTWLSDGAWHASDTTIENASAKYFLIVVRGRNNASVEEETVLADINNTGAFIINPTFQYGTISNAGAEIATGHNRMRTDYIHIDNAVVLMQNRSYDYNLNVYDSEKTFLYSSPWYGWNDSYLMNQEANLRNCYVRLVIAKSSGHDNTIERDDILAFNNMFEIIEYEENDFAARDVYSYPNYYLSEVKTTINSICNKTKYDGINFVMLTDLHDNGQDVSTFTRYQIEAVRKLKDSCQIDFVIMGGDLTDGLFATKDLCIEKFTKLVNAFNTIGVPVLALRGNHDDNSYQGSKSENIIFSRQEFYSHVIAPLSTGNHTTSAKTYYYHDFDRARVICMDYLDYPEVITDGNYQNVGIGAAWRGYSVEQVAWLGQSLLSNTKDIVVVTSHYSTNPSLMPELEDGVQDRYAVNVSSMMKAFNNRTIYAFNGVNYDFSNAVGKIVVQATGHSHAFGALKEDGIVWATTGSPNPEVTKRFHDSTEYETMSERTYFTNTEPHFNIFCVNDSNVDIISFGAMGDLNFTL